MEKLKFTKEIKATAEKVYKSMLGIDDKLTYQIWTSAFNPTSTYEGSWDKDSKIYFVGTDENGIKGGMISKIEENKFAEFVSICHYGFLNGDVEVTSGEQVEKWAGGFENYTFKEKEGLTTVTVDIDVIDDYLTYFKDTYPKALDLLKESVEK